MAKAARASPWLNSTKIRGQWPIFFYRKGSGKRRVCQVSALFSLFPRVTKQKALLVQGFLREEEKKEEIGNQFGV
jgi:hypothetical protein